jgi:predicted ferric reductase
VRERDVDALGALAVAVLGMRHTLWAGRYSSDPVLSAWWGLMFALAVGSLLLVYLGRPLGHLRRPWRVASVARAAERIWSVLLEPVNHEGLRFRAGQFAWIRLGASPFSLREHPFSIASAPREDGRLEFLIKEAGDFTSTVGGIAPGTRAYVDGPHGHLWIEGRAEPGLCLIAGGVGFAPLLSMLRVKTDPRPVLLLYGNRHAEQILAAEDIAASGAEVVHVLQDPPAGWTGATGLMDRAFIRDRCAAAARDGWLFVLCGPPPMMREVRAGLAALGVPASRILEERFVYD